MNENTTEPNFQTILDAINGLRSEMNEQINGLRSEMNEQINGLRSEMNEKISGLHSEIRDLKARITLIENDVGEIKQMQFVFENEFDRLKSLSHKALELGHESRADIRIIRKEVEAWAKDVMELERKVA